MLIGILDPINVGRRIFLHRFERIIPIDIGQHRELEFLGGGIYIVLRLTKFHKIRAFALMDSKNSRKFFETVSFIEPDVEICVTVFLVGKISGSLENELSVLFSDCRER